MAPTVSINLCCYNSEKFLEETLQSIFSQTYKDWELVIINDGSTDATEAIINKYIRHGYSIIYHYQQNKGLGSSRNEALKRSQGEFIAFIDHDDLWMPEKLEKQITLFQDMDVGLVFTDVVNFDDKGSHQILYDHFKYRTGYCFSNLLLKNYLCLSSVMIRKKCLNGLSDWFCSKLSWLEDRDLFLRIASKWKLDIVDLPLIKRRVHSNNLTSQIDHSVKKEELNYLIERLIKQIPNFSSTYKREIKEMRTNHLVREAFYLFNSNRAIEARKLLFTKLLTHHKIFGVFLITLLPKKLAVKVSEAKLKRQIKPG